MRYSLRLLCRRRLLLMLNCNFTPLRTNEISSSILILLSFLFLLFSTKVRGPKPLPPVPPPARSMTQPGRTWPAWQAREKFVWREKKKRGARGRETRDDLSPRVSLSRTRISSSLHFSCVCLAG